MSGEEPGYVYFVRAKGGGPIKIGRATNVQERLSHLQIGCPVHLRVIAIIPGGKTLEKYLHTMFAAWRLHGEWFSADAEGLAELIAEAQHRTKRMLTEQREAAALAAIASAGDHLPARVLPIIERSCVTMRDTVASSDRFRYDLAQAEVYPRTEGAP